jgi:hypothetical protein
MFHLQEAVGGTMLLAKKDIWIERVQLILEHPVSSIHGDEGEEDYSL